LALPYQNVSAGRLEHPYGIALKRLCDDKAVERLWAKDATLWQADESQASLIGNRLGWIGVLDRMRSEAAEIGAFVADVEAAGLRNTVLLGTSASTHAGDVFTRICPAPEGKRFFLLDTPDPESIRAIEREIELESTLFIVAGKSGNSIQTVAQLLYFLDRLKTAGISAAGSRFAAITDEGTYLSRLAAQYRFRKLFLNAGDVGVRYSALSHFGLVPAALCGVPLEAVLDGAEEMRAASGPHASGPNPALQLAALLGAAEAGEHDRLVLLATPSLVPLSHWIEQLIAGSTGKESRGIVPVVDEGPWTLPTFEQGCVVATLRQEGDDAAPLEEAARELGARGVPTVDIRLAGAQNLGAEFFKWEVAAALAAVLLGVNPFDEPNEQESKARTLQLLEVYDRKGAIPSPTVRMFEAGIELYAEGRTRQEISTLRLSDVLRTFLGMRTREDYVALLAFIEWNEEDRRMLARIRACLAEALGVPVLLGCGPRYLHSLGQLFKGGPPTGMFLLITAAHPQDLAIPGARYSFGQLLLAQALGDFESLQRRNRPVLRLHFKEGAAAGLDRLALVVEQTAAHLRAAPQ
jgi:transaldolase / glucose-6-phosphate isomerase